MEGTKARCQSCGREDIYETTGEFNPMVPLHGGMLRLQEPFSRYNWPVYDGALGDKMTPPSMMLCTNCQGYVSFDRKHLSLVQPGRSARPGCILLHYSHTERK